MTFFFSKYIRPTYKDSSIFYWPSNQKDHKYKITNLIINCINDPIFKKRIFYSNNGFKNNTYFNKEHLANNYVYSTQDKKLNVVFPQNIYNKKLSAFIGFFYTIESEFFTSKVHTVEYYRNSIFKYKWEQKFISHFKNFHVKKKCTYKQYNFHLLTGNSIKPYINKFEKEYERVYAFVPFQHVAIKLANSEVFKYYASVPPTDERKKWWPAPVWKQHLAAKKIVCLLRHDGAYLKVNKKHFVWGAFGSLNRFIYWRFKKNIRKGLHMLYNLLLFCGKSFTLNRPSSKFLFAFILYKKWFHILFKKFKNYLNAKSYKMYKKWIKPRDKNGNFIRINGKKRILRTFRKQTKKSIRLNSSNLAFKKIIKVYNKFKKPLIYINKFIYQMFKPNTDKKKISRHKHQGTILQLFRNDEMINYLTDIRILEEEYDYWDDENTPFETLLQSTPENLIFAMNRKIFFYYKLNEVYLNPQPAFWTLKNLLKEYYILKNQYIHNFIEHKLFAANYIKMVHQDHIIFDYFLIGAYLNDRARRLENNNAFKKSMALVYKETRYFELQTIKGMKHAFNSFKDAWRNLRRKQLNIRKKHYLYFNWNKFFEKTRKLKLFYKEKSLKIKKEYRPKMLNKMFLRKKNKVLHLKKLFSKPPAFFRVYRKAKKVIKQRKNFKKLKKEIFTALKIKKPKINYMLLTKKATIWWHKILRIRQLGKQMLSEKIMKKIETHPEVIKGKKVSVVLNKIRKLNYIKWRKFRSRFMLEEKKLLLLRNLLTRKLRLEGINNKKKLLKIGIKIFSKLKQKKNKNSYRILSFFKNKKNRLKLNLFKFFLFNYVLPTKNKKNFEIQNIYFLKKNKINIDINALKYVYLQDQILTEKLKIIKKKWKNDSIKELLKFLLIIRESQYYNVQFQKNLYLFLLTTTQFYNKEIYKFPWFNFLSLIFILRKRNYRNFLKYRKLNNFKILKLKKRFFLPAKSYKYIMNYPKYKIFRFIYSFKKKIQSLPKYKKWRRSRFWRACLQIRDSRINKFKKTIKEIMKKKQLRSLNWRTIELILIKKKKKKAWTKFGELPKYSRKIKLLSFYKIMMIRSKLKKDFYLKKKKFFKNKKFEKKTFNGSKQKFTDTF